MADLLSSGRYSDFKIICKGNEWNIHRAIVCPQSAYFAALCDSSFKEVAIGEIDLYLEIPEHIEKMLTFLYTGDYDHSFQLDITAISTLSISDHETSFHDNSTGNTEHGSPCDHMTGPDITHQRLHIAMYALGDKYIIPSLRSRAVQKFISSLPSQWIEEEWALVQDIVENTSSTDLNLKDPIIDQWLENSSDLLSNAEFCERLAGFPEIELPFLRKHSKIKIEEEKTLKRVLVEIERLIEALRRAEETKRIWKESSRDLLLNTFNSLRSCRHCGVDFESYFEDRGFNELNGLRLTIRCRRCNTKHRG